MTNTEGAGQGPAQRKERSPSFPYIGLSRAVERVRAVYANARRHEARVVDVAAAWGWGAKSSGTLQTIAALLAYGLLEDQGSGDNRKLKVTDLAFKALEDERPGEREAALAEAALKPKLIAEYAERWRDGRPGDGICISELRIDRGFTDDGARQFLKVFDDSIEFTRALKSDKKDDSDAVEWGQTVDNGTGAQLRSPLLLPVKRERIVPAEGERVVFTEETDPQNYLKLIASGAIDELMLEALEDFVKRQKRRLSRPRVIDKIDAGNADESAN
ncbi:hypothetical protein ACQR1I_14180 [Bradyrhizobium sp. HKCCYLS2038]|uniref:hypothetical protein n=1 Tax=unclassified Bradyrhizobium TaxID=2631580 RepID=UPI003EBC1705